MSTEEMMAEALPRWILSHLAREFDSVMHAPFTVAAVDHALLLLTVERGRARLAESTEFPPDFARDPSELAAVTQRKVEEFQGTVCQVSGERWPLDDGAGGVVQVEVDDQALRVCFAGDDSEYRLSDFLLVPPYGMGMVFAG